MLFIINGLKYDTKKMEKVADVKNGINAKTYLLGRYILG